MLLLGNTNKVVFLVCVGVAAGRADDPAVAARDYAEKIRNLAKGWDSAGERGVPANDQSKRA